MKKIISALLTILLAAGVVFAYQYEEEQTTSETIFYIKATHTLPVSSAKSIKEQFKAGKFEGAIPAFLRECKPYTENVNMNVLGFDFTVNVNSEGWANSKCIYNISMKVNNISGDMKEILGMKEMGFDLTSFSPKIRCEFNREQLDTFVDYIAESNSIDSVKNAVYKPAFGDLSSQYQDKVFSMIKNDHVCDCVNKDELFKQFTNSTSGKSPKIDDYSGKENFPDLQL